MLYVTNAVEVQSTSAYSKSHRALPHQAHSANSLNVEAEAPSTAHGAQPRMSMICGDPKASPWPRSTATGSSTFARDTQPSTSADINQQTGHTTPHSARTSEEADDCPCTMSRSWSSQWSGDVEQADRNDGDHAGSGDHAGDHAGDHGALSDSDDIEDDYRNPQGKPTWSERRRAYTIAETGVKRTCCMLPMP